MLLCGAVESAEFSLYRGGKIKTNFALKKKWVKTAGPVV